MSTSDSRNSSTTDRLLAAIAEAFKRARIPYMVIGGQAVLVHGMVRMTQDIDVTLGLSTDEIGRVLPVIASVGLKPLVDAEEFARETFVIPCAHAETALRVDVILSSSPYEREALTRARPARFAGVDVQITAPEDLIIHKVIAGRARDLEDARGVLIKHSDLDRRLIQRWLKDWSALTGEPLVERFDDVERAARGS